MSRPRLAVVISAIVASAVAFIVVSRWRLFGTLAGAAIVPLVYTLVSHWSTECLERLGGWIHRRAAHRRAAGRVADHTVDEPIGVCESVSVDAVRSEEREGVDPLPVRADKGEQGQVKRPSTKVQWSLAAFACLALAISIYSFTVSKDQEKTIVREKVIEKTVTVTVPSDRPVAQVVGADTSAMTRSTRGQSDTTVTTVSTSRRVNVNSTVTAPTNRVAAPSSTTTVPEVMAAEEAPVSTTVPAPSTTTTSLPDAPTVE
ncbi:MAG: hypothetical protein ACOX8V_06980 [Thermoleophilia bacterium]|jgi:hypothetical protein